MTDEERAGKYAEEKEFEIRIKCRSARDVIKTAYLDGMLDERNWQGDMDATIAQNMEKLQEQIEKMKHCVNCRYALGGNIPICITCTRGGAYYDGKKTDKWKLME